jgi:hypothetical protein
MLNGIMLKVVSILALPFVFVYKTLRRIVHRIRKILNWLVAEIQDAISFEAYYRFKKQFAKYFKKVVVPAIGFTVLSSLLYAAFVYLFRWKFQTFMIFAFMLGFTILMIVFGCLRGEDRQDDFYADT